MASGRTGMRKRSGISEWDLTGKAGLESASTDKDHVVALPTLQDPEKRERVHTNCRQGKKRSCSKKGCKAEIDLCKVDVETPLNQSPVIDMSGADGPRYLHHGCTPASYKNEVTRIMQDEQASKETDAQQKTAVA